MKPDKAQKAQKTKEQKEFKQLIKDSLQRAADQYKSENQSTMNIQLDHGLIEAYEIGFYINFQPALIKLFLKTIVRYLSKFNKDIDRIQQIVNILSKVAITVTSLRTLERMFNNEALMNALDNQVMGRYWQKY